MFANSFPPDAEMARLTARMLLEIRAVHFRRDEPYSFTSGLASPVYIDCRKLISYPAVRASSWIRLRQARCATSASSKFDVVAGGETAGIPFAAWIADRARPADALRAQEAQGLRPQRADRGRR